LVSGGVMAKPRLVVGYQDAVSGEIKNKPLELGEPLALPRQHVDLIKKSMFEVTQDGTARLAFKGANYPAGGKTGTSQVFSLKQGESYNKEELEERLKDHSWFIAFSPVVKPQIAIAVIVENGGFGSQAAAPAARKVLDAWWAKKELDENEPMTEYMEQIMKANSEGNR
ncbi:MAG: penicillin-binding transpeptidase domain-containing protein, partial [Limnobacter sp.]|nr:penicillin-binding transpeptidase domain-containing protein [Limnobacter sp.]